jgi:hypothetical protein
VGLLTHTAASAPKQAGSVDGKAVRLTHVAIATIAGQIQE